MEINFETEIQGIDYEINFDCEVIENKESNSSECWGVPVSEDYVTYDINFNYVNYVIEKQSSRLIDPTPEIMKSIEDYIEDNRESIIENS